MGRVGIQVGALTAPAEIASVAAEAERLGYSEIWMAEDYFELGGVASVATALAATARIPVGLGVVAAAARHPAVTAMEFATIAGAHPGRFMAGLGHGAPAWLRQMGLVPESPMRLLRESVASVRQLLDGDELSQSGEHFCFDGVRLAHPPNQPAPIFLGVHGPASLRLSGEIADGTLLGWFSSPGYVAWARQRIEEGRVRGRRRGAHQLVVLCVLSISEDDPQGAREDLGRWAGPMLSAMSESPLLTASGAGRELLDIISDDHPTSRQSLPDELLSDFAAVGHLAACTDTINRLLAAGADRVVLVPNPAGYRSTTAMVEQIQIAAALTDIGPSRAADCSDLPQSPDAVR